MEVLASKQHIESQQTALGDQLSEAFILDGEFQSGSAAFEMLNEHEKNFAPKNDDSLPSVFNHPLNCSDWTLRLSQSSVLQPTTDNSKASAQHVDEYMRQRSHPLGDISKNDSSRPHFDMSFESPLTYRSPVPCYKPQPTNGDWKSIDTYYSTSFEISSDNSTISSLDMTMTPPFNDADETGDTARGNLSSADFTKVSGSLTALSSSTNHPTARSRASVVSDSLKSSVSGVYSKDGNRFGGIELAIDNFHMKSTSGKENVEPYVEVSSKRTKSVSEKSSTRSRYATTVASTGVPRGNGSASSIASSVSKTSQTSRVSKDKEPRLPMVTKENLNYPVSKTVSDSVSKKVVVESNVHPRSDLSDKLTSFGDSGLETQSSAGTSVKTVNGKYSRSSSTPIKDLMRQESKKDKDVQAKSFPENAAVVSQHLPNELYSDRLSVASSLSTGLLTDSSLIEDFDETVQLPLPSRLTTRPIRNMSKQPCKTMMAATQTSMLSYRGDTSGSSKKGVTPMQPLSRTPDGYQYRSGPCLLVPQELRFDGVCCVGLSAHGTLLVNNPTSKWQSVQLAIKHLTVDSNAEDPNSSPFSARAKFTIDPNASETIKVLFAPKIAGVYVAQLTLSSSLSMAGRPPMMITLQAVAENPKVELVTGSRSSREELHFRPLPWGCETYEYVSLVNKGRATIPIRLVISSSVPNCYVFDKRTACMNRSGESLGRFSSPDRTRERLVMPMLHTCVMLGGDADGAERYRQIPIYFLAPKRSSCKGYGRIEEITGSIKAEIDVPTSHSRLLASLGIYGTVGTAKLHLPKCIEPIMFTTSQKQAIKIPLRNSGDIPLDIDLSFSDRLDMFNVRPSELTLDPGSEQTVTVSFTAQVGSTETRFESYLFMRVKPDGPVYEVKLVSIRAEGMSSLYSPTTLVGASSRAKDPAEDEYSSHSPTMIRGVNSCAKDLVGDQSNSYYPTPIRSASSRTKDMAEDKSRSYYPTMMRAASSHSMDPAVSRDIDEFLSTYKDLALTYPLSSPRPKDDQHKVTSGKSREPISAASKVSASSVKLLAARTALPSYSLVRLTTAASRTALPSSSLVRLTTAAHDSPIVTVKVPVMASSDADAQVSKQSLRFPSCSVGTVSELPLEFTNECLHMVKWSVSCCAPAYVKRSADETCDSLKYSVFKWSDQDGCLPTAATEKVLISFCPNEVGHYSQLWEVRFHELDSQDSQQHTLQVEMFGLTKNESHTRIDARLNGSVSDCTQSTTTIQRSPPVLDGTRVRMRSVDGMLTVEPNKMLFDQTSRYETRTCKLEIRNKGSNTYKVELSDVSLPFNINHKHKSLILRPRHYLRVPVEFIPKTSGEYSAEITVRTDAGDNFTVRLHGICA